MTAAVLIDGLFTATSFREGRLSRGEPSDRDELRANTQAEGVFIQNRPLQLSKFTPTAMSSQNKTEPVLTILPHHGHTGLLPSVC